MTEFPPSASSPGSQEPASPSPPPYRQTVQNQELAAQDEGYEMAQLAANAYTYLMERFGDDPDAVIALHGMMGAVTYFRVQQIHASHRMMRGEEELAQTKRALASAEVAARRSEERAVIDPLTGLFNRAALLAGGRRVRPSRHGMEQAERAGAPVAWVTFLMDLDNFKPVNDTYGHPRGDRCLRMVAAALLASVRDEDEVYRLGGDEFAIIAPIRAPEGINEVARGVPLRFHGNLDIIHAGSGDWLFSEGFAPDQVDRLIAGSVRGSFGAYISHGPVLDRSLALVRADEAMYAVKRERKGQPPISPEGPQ